MFSHLRTVLIKESLRDTCEKSGLQGVEGGWEECGNYFRFVSGRKWSSLPDKVEATISAPPLVVVGGLYTLVPTAGDRMRGTRPA